RAYEALLQRYGTDYQQVDHTNIGPAVFERFFAPAGYLRRTLDNAQRFDLEGLRGRLLSASYSPAPGHPQHEPMMRALAQIFHEHQSDGEVTIEYDTEVYFGR